MRIFPSKRVLAFVLPFLFSFFLEARPSSLKPEFGLVKSRDSVAFLSCVDKEEGVKECSVYAHKKGETPKAVSRKIRLLKLEKKNKRFSSYIDRETKEEELSSLSYMPITTLSQTLIAKKGEKFRPMFLLSSLDLVAGPVALMVDGVRRLYKLIQGTYLKAAWETLAGVNKKSSIRLSRKDFKEFLKAIKVSSV